MSIDNFIDPQNSPLVPNLNLLTMFGSVAKKLRTATSSAEIYVRQPYP